MQEACYQSTLPGRMEEKVEHRRVLNLLGCLCAFVLSAVTVPEGQAYRSRARG